MGRQFEASHINYLTVTRAVGDEIAAALMERRNNSMDLNLYWQTENVIEFLLSVGIPAFAAIVIIGVNLLAGKVVVQRVRTVAAQIEPLVNDPDDRVVVVLENIGEVIFKKDLDPKTISEVLVAVTRGLSGAPLITPEKPVDAA